MTSQKTSPGGVRSGLVWLAVLAVLTLQRVSAGVGRRVAARAARLRASGEAGMATAEYAIVTLAAVAFAGLLLAILRGGEVRELLLGIIRDALSR